MFRVVSLSEWMGQPEVHVRDLTGQRTLRFKPGDTLAGGIIVCIDYRNLPSPGNDFLRSDSRVILRVGPDYFAVDRGRTLAEKYKMPTDQLPKELVQVK
jgi:hypothetical protein